MGDVIGSLTPDQLGLLRKMVYENLASGETTNSLRNSGNTSVTLASQQIRFSYFMAMRSFLCNNLASVVTATAAAGATFAGMALYSAAANGDLTFLGQAVDTANLWTVANNRYQLPISTPVQIVAGQVYAFGVLFVGTTPPSVLTTDQTAAGALGPLLGFSGKLAGLVGGLSTFPATQTAGGLSNSGAYVIGEILP